MYQRQSNQPARLGSWAGLGDAQGIIDSIGNAVNNVTSTIVMGQVERKRIGATRDIEVTTQVEGTKQLDITTKGLVQQAMIEAQRLGIQLNSISGLILVSGGVVAALMLAAGLTYSTIKK